MKYFGAEGFQLINGVQLERHEYLRGKIAESVNMVCVNPKDVGGVTLFRVYGKGVYNPASEYEKEFNDNMRSLCDNKNVRYIRFVSPALSNMGVYKARFKQMSCFFRNEPLNVSQVFAMTDL